MSEAHKRGNRPLEWAVLDEPDWTVDPETGRSNSSSEFQEIVDHVERLIRDEAHYLISGRADMTARLIVAQLAHKFGMAPSGL